MCSNDIWRGVNGENLKNCKIDKMECKAEGAVARGGGLGVNGEIQKIAKADADAEALYKNTTSGPRRRELKKITRRRGRKMLKSKK